MTQKHITIVAFCGPSGSGKSEMAKRLLETYPENLAKWKQATTRVKRDAADDYVFMTKSMYDVVRSTLTCRTEFNGNHYGTFPEPTPPDSAVLTIADAMGLRDLISDVDNHNNHVLNGHTGKLGLHPVRLVTVLMQYALVDEEIEARGGTRGGTRDGAFLRRELDSLNAVTTFDHTLDSTGFAWTDPVDFFNDVIWPAIVTPFAGDDAESFRQKIEHQLIEIGEASGRITDNDLLRDILADLDGVTDRIRDWLDSEPESAGSVDAIDDVLSGTIQCDTSVPLMNAVVVHEDGAAQMAVEAGYDDAERIYSNSLAQAEIDEAAEDDGAPTHATDFLNDRPIITEPAVVEAVPEVVVEAVIEPVVEEIVEPEPIQVATVEEPVNVESYAPLTPFAEICKNDITDWMLSNTVGMEAFESEQMFKTIFSQYISAHGGNPNGIEVSSQVAKDSRGGRVVDYVAVMPTGERFGIEFNERIKRAVNYGQR
jgi:hypothetical protein